MKKGIRNSFLQTMGDRLRAARDAKGYSRQDAADRLNECSFHPPSDEMNDGRLKQWEYGNNPIDVSWIPAICDVLSCDAGFLFGEYEQLTKEKSDACAITGLSEPAVQVLIDLQCGDIVSQIVTQPEFAEMCEKIRRLQDSAELQHIELLEEVANIWRGVRGEKKFPVDDRRDSLRYRIGTLFSVIVEHISSGGTDNG